MRWPRLIVTAGAALLAIGGWAVASTAWGGIPDEAWRLLAQAGAAAAALLLGSAVGRTADGRRLLLCGLLLGVAAQAVEAVAVVASGGAPSDWFLVRAFEGPIGYHNAEGALFALGLPLGVLFAADERPALRALGGASLPALTAALLLSQSRGALGAAAVALVLQAVASRSLRVCAAAAVPPVSLAVLFAALRRVDAAIDLHGPAGSGSAGTHYAEVTLVLAVAAALAAVVAVRDVRVPPWAVVGALVLVVAGAAAVEHAKVAGFADRLGRTALTDADPDAPPGATRLVTLSLNGRRDAWRVALDGARGSPVVGNGAGTFARQWTADRHLDALYIVQPHSIELELLDELGAVGLGLFALFIGAVALALRRGPERAPAVAAGSMLTALLVEASVDWTWSFPVLVATVALAVGATARSASTRPVNARVLAIAGAAALAALVVLAPRFLAARATSQGQALARTDPAAAAERLRFARALDPWSADATAAAGRLDEAAGKYAAAAVLYARAASLSQQPWLDRYRQARALAHFDGAARGAACRAAVRANPGEPQLHAGPCAERS